MIGEVLAEADEEIYHRLASLVNGETITTYIDTGVIYPQIKKESVNDLQFPFGYRLSESSKNNIILQWGFYV